MSKQRKEIEALLEAKTELRRFQQRLDALLEKVKNSDPDSAGKERAALKRSAMDLRMSLAQITTAVRFGDTYYYQNE